MLHMTDRLGRRIAKILKVVFLAALGISLIVCVMTLLGRVRIQVESGVDKTRYVMLAAPKKELPSLNFLVDVEYLRNQVVELPPGGEPGTAASIGIMLQVLLSIIPDIIMYIALIRVFDGIQRGHFFERKNVSALIVSGIAMLAGGILLPIFLGGIIPAVVNHVSTTKLIISQHLVIGRMLIYGAVLLLAAYIFSYGSILKEKAEHEA